MGFKSDTQALYASRDTYLALFRRDFRRKYKGSFFGWLWSLASPAALLVIYSVAIGGFLGAALDRPFFVIYLYSGILIWTLFSNILRGSVNSFRGDAGIIRRVPFRKEHLLLSSTSIALVEFCVHSLLLLPLYIIYGAEPNWRFLPLLLIAVLCVVFIALAVGTLLAIFNVYVRDIAYFVDVALQFGFWLVPIVYTYEMATTFLADFGLSRLLFNLNPTLYPILASHVALVPTAPDSQPWEGSALLVTLLVTLVLGLLFLLLAQRTLARFSGLVAERV